MAKNKNDITSFFAEHPDTSFSTMELLGYMDMQRTNLSSILNRMVADGIIFKKKGKPVLYQLVTVAANAPEKAKMADTEKVMDAFSNLIGCDGTLKKCIQQAKAAILYPPSGLTTLITGQTGVGKTMFAVLMHKFSISQGVIVADAPMISFNCADYANNPQLLMSHLFGSKRGSYTGADHDRDGLIDAANGGVLFLDEIHRLPPEGQEMLFYLIDHGKYRPLGEVNQMKTANVMLLCATTELPESSFLSTFIRRIPMIINIPSLGERTIEERCQMIISFLGAEAKRTGRSILVTPDAMRHLAIYRCEGNVGQLKSDIQIGCASSFVRSISGNKDTITLNLQDLPECVQKGIFYYRRFQNDLEKLLPTQTNYVFTADGSKAFYEDEHDKRSDDFYQNVERRIIELRSSGLAEKSINTIMSVDVEIFFKKQLETDSHIVNKEQLYKIVDYKLVQQVEVFLANVGAEFNRIYPQKVFYGLCLHIQSAITRMKNGESIENPKVLEIVEKYPNEYAACMNFASDLEKEYSLRISIDEVTYLTMFICKDVLKDCIGDIHPVVLIAMHGNSTARSMADVVNSLIGENNTYGFDMSLDMPIQAAYLELKSLIKELDNGAGIVMLVDMGSLYTMGEMIAGELGVKIRILDMVTTALGLECSRRALLETDIDTIVKEAMSEYTHFIQYGSGKDSNTTESVSNVLITMCMTGEGSAMQMKAIIEDHININESNVEVIPMAISNHIDLLNRVNRLKQSKNIIGIVGTFDPELYNIPFVPISELFTNPNFTKVKELFTHVQMESHSKDSLNPLFDYLQTQMTTYSVSQFKSLVLRFLFQVCERLKCFLSDDQTVGLILHIACAIENIKLGQASLSDSFLTGICQNRASEMKILEDEFTTMERLLEFKMSPDGFAAILMILLKLS